MIYMINMIYNFEIDFTILFANQIIFKNTYYMIVYYFLRKEGVKFAV